MKHIYKFTLPVHILGLAFLTYCIMQAQWLFLGIAFLMWVLMSIGMEVGVHRLFSHRSFKTYRWIEVLLAYLGSIAGQGSVMFWVAVHKGYHHPYSDTLKDPHSPVHGFFHSYVGWLMDETQNTISYRSTVDLMRDPVQVYLHKHYYKIIILTILVLFLINPLLCGAYFLASTVCIQQNFIVNYVCHDKRFGYRSFEVKDRSRNIPLLSLLSWGLSLHNNHHYDPASYTLSFKKSEIDLSAVVIRLISITRKEPRGELANV